ncbi:MAG: transporter substrate-binding domain-containing protein [Motiliproteus sp.]
MYQASDNSVVMDDAKADYLARPFCLLLVVWLLLSGMTSIASARSFDDIKASGYLSVAVYRDFPPYAYEERGVAKGLDVDVAQELAKGLGVDLTLHWMIADEGLGDDLRNHVWKGHYMARKEEGVMLRREVADVMMRVPYDREFAFMKDPDGRVINDLVHFFAPYQRESWGLVYDSTRIENIENLAMFQYERVGVEIDSLPDFYLSSAFGGRLRNNVVHHTTLMAAYQAMADTQVAAVMGMQSQLQWLLSRDDQEKIVTADVPFPNLIKRQWDVGMAVKDDHRQLGYALEDIIDRLVEQGQMKDLFARHGVNYQRPDRYLQQ